MKLTELQKNKIIEILDSEEFKNNLYVDQNGKPLDAQKRAKLGQYYTPGKICIQMIEKFECESFAGKNILDPTCGSGNLIIACLIAGADTDKVFGNEYDADVIPTCRARIRRTLELLNRDPQEFKDWQVHQGNALQTRCLTDFSAEYCINYNSNFIDDLTYAQNNNSWEIENKQAAAKTAVSQSFTPVKLFSF